MTWVGYTVFAAVGVLAFFAALVVRRAEDRDPRAPEPFWGEAPTVRADPVAWASVWWRRVTNLAGVADLFLFLGLGALVVWRFVSRRLVTEDLYWFAGAACAGVVFEMLRRWPARRGRRTNG